jgi:hypothetical protein
MADVHDAVMPDELEFKPDFARARATWKRFWDGELTERPILLMRVPKRTDVPPPPLPRAYRMGVAPVEDILDDIEEWAGAFHWCGEAIPGFRVTFAPDDLALLLGAELQYTGDGAAGDLTGWIEPFLKNYDQEIGFHPESRWCERMVSCIRALRKRFDGRLLVSWTQMQGGLDALSAIRGPEELLLDLVNRPEQVDAALRQIDKAVGEAHDFLAREYDVPAFGSLTRHDIYHRGRIDVPQCDFSCMISEDMFRRFELPSLRNECAGLDAAEYHLDGPGAIRHLEAVCEIDTIKIIQWVPGAGAPAKQDWTDLFDRIDRLGKGQLRGGSLEAVTRLWQRYRSDHLCCSVSGLSSPAEAEDAIAAFEGLSRHPMTG